MEIERNSAHNVKTVRRFVVHSPLVAMKSLSGRKLVTLETRTSGDILESYGERGRPGLVLVGVNQERFLIWKRDLEERAELLAG